MSFFPRDAIANLRNSGDTDSVLLGKRAMTYIFRRRSDRSRLLNGKFRAFASPIILGCRDDFQVAGIAAGTLSAQVIEDHTIRYGAELTLEHSAVNRGTVPANHLPTISSARITSVRNPARGRKPAILFCDVQRGIGLVPGTESKVLPFAHATIQVTAQSHGGDVAAPALTQARGIRAFGCILRFVHRVASYKGNLVDHDRGRSCAARSFCCLNYTAIAATKA